MAEIAFLQNPTQQQKTGIRKDAILDAAQVVFAEKGFEVATIQDVATACGMSAGNIYRYFTSKNAIVSGLVERDRNEMASRFAELSNAPDQIEGFETLGRLYIKQECARNAKLTLEIWAAASRRPELRDLCLAMEEAVSDNMRQYLSRITAEGKLAPGVDPAMVSHLLMALAQAIFRDVALKPKHDIDQDLDVLFATMRAAFAGHIKVPTSTQTSSERNHD